MDDKRLKSFSETLAPRGLTFVRFNGFELHLSYDERADAVFRHYGETVWDSDLEDFVRNGPSGYLEGLFPGLQRIVVERTH